MAMTNQVFGQGKLGFWIPNHKVGVVARDQCALAVMLSRKTCRTVAHPADEICDLMARSTCFGPDRAEAELQTGDAAPRVAKVSLFHEFKFGCAG